MFVIYFRPSSHSEDGTIVATFKTQKHAAEALRKLKHLGARRLDKKVGVACLDAEYKTIEKCKEILGELSPINVEETEDYRQEVIIEATVPLGTTLETAPLMLDQRDLQILKGLIKECGKPELVNTKKKTIIRFRSVNEDMLFTKRNPLPNEKYGKFWFGANQVLVTKTFRVKGLF